ncbi:DUF397 domain-containing protein [Streptomyces erythrochromogenes]|uniref:DUF397 domain-containing protein n=1 Tax=Streptomyces erythrochromogenes TaxID=285574 RepID=UPI00386EFE1E|nr:DUF397 domain-containing protein [Streptomyces erythrochromogenes]
MATVHDGLSKVGWRRSSHSTAPEGLCVEVADGVAGLVPVRDSTRPDGGVVVVSAAAWGPFVAALKDC